MKLTKFVLTYLGPCDFYIDMATGLTWAVGDAVVVDRETKERVLADVAPSVDAGARWHVAPYKPDAEPATDNLEPIEVVVNEEVK